MLEASRRRILDTLPDDALVLDVGGWARPLPRADWVIDLQPYETRGMYGSEGGGPERFTAATWVQRDLCDREPYPFDDDEFDFVVCSNTLEDVRDPIWVSQEIARIGRAGYVEVPSPLEELSRGVQGPWAGWGHHHWIVEVRGAGLDFVFKSGVVHGRDLLPPNFHRTLAPEERVQALWWTGAFTARERVMIGDEDLDAYLAGLVEGRAANGPGRSRRGLRELLRRGGG